MCAYSHSEHLANLLYSVPVVLLSISREQSYPPQQVAVQSPGSACHCRHLLWFYLMPLLNSIHMQGDSPIKLSKSTKVHKCHVIT